MALLLLDHRQNLAARVTVREISGARVAFKGHDMTNPIVSLALQ